MGGARDTTWPVIDLGGVTELRVHGVGGTPAAEVLDDPAPVQVSGDRTAGVMWSPAGIGEDDGPGAEANPGGPRWRLEAYSWGGLTGRSALRALWLLLLPFSLVNLAGWMAPARTGRGTGPRRGLVRLVSLGLTGLYVLFAAEVGMDFLGVQCAGDPDCRLYGTWPLQAGGPVTRRAVWGAVVPLLVVALLWGLGHRSRKHYELWSSDPDEDTNADDQVRGGLAGPGFWSGSAYAEVLAGVHVGVSLALVALLLGLTTTAVSAGPAGPVVVGLCAAFLAFGVLLSLVSRVRTRVPAAGVEACGAGLLVVAGIVAWTTEPSGATAGTTPETLPGLIDVFDLVVDVTIVAGLTLAALDLVLIYRHRKDLSRLERRLCLLGPLTAVTLAVLVTGAFLSGVTMFIADFFGDLRSAADGPVPRAADGAVTLLYPEPFEAFARSFLLAPIVLLAGATVGVLYVAVTKRRAVHEAAGRRLEAWQAVGRPADDACDVRENRPERDGSFWWPMVTLGAAVGGVVTLTVVALGFAVPYCAYRMYWRVTAPDDAVNRMADLDQVTWGLIPLRLGIAVLTFLPVVLFLVLRRGLTEPSARRSIAIFWDVLTFWPRSFHPLAPPSYAERAVPEIRVRLRRIWLAGGRVVLLGHSQGSVLAAAAVASLPEHDDDAYPGAPALAERLTLVTYGSPLSRLYGRFFPAYFDRAFFAGLGRRLRVDTPDGEERCWLNFYRDTDPVGRDVRAPGPTLDNVFLADPATPWWFEGDGNPPVRRHGHDGYRGQHEFRRHLYAHVERLRPEPTVIDVSKVEAEAEAETTVPNPRTGAS